MKLKTTIILLIVAAIGISYVFLYEKKQLPQEEWERLQKKVLPDFKASMIKKIELNNEGGKVILEKTADNYWHITEPLKLRSDNSEVNSILSEFEFMNKVGSFSQEGDKPFDLKDYGLDAPTISITMYTDIPAKPDKIQVMGPKDKYTVFVGKKLAAGDNVYIKLDASDEVVVVPGTLLGKVTKNVLDLRSKWVFAFDKDAVEKIEVKTADYHIVCDRKGSFWRLSEPVNDLADLEKVRDVLGKLKNLQIDRADFITEDSSDLTKFGLDNPRFTVTLYEKGVSQSVLFGHSLDNKVYAKRTDEPTVFFLKDTILADLSKRPNDLRDRKVVRFDSIGTYGINKLEIKTPGDLITIEKTLDLDWKLTKPVNIYADQDTVKNFIEKLKTLEIEDFVSDAPADLSAYGLKNPVFEISVTKEEDKELAKFYVGNMLSDGSKCYVKRVGEEPVYTVPTTEFYDKIENPLLRFRDRLVCDFNKDLVKKLVIEKPDRTFVCDITNRRDAEGQFQWELSRPVQTIADTNAINQIIWDMSFLKVDSYIVKAPKDLKPFGLNDPRIKVSVTYEKAPETPPEEQGQNKKEEKAETGEKAKESLEKIVETRTLLIGKKLKDGDKVSSYGMFADSDLVFELPWPKINNLDAELAPTRILNFERTDVKELTLNYNERTISLKKINNVWKLKNDEQKEVQGREVDYFIRSLNELKGNYIEQYKTTNLTQFSLDKPQAIITIGLEGGDAVLYVGKKKDTDGYYLKNKDSDYIYVVGNESVANLIKKEEDFTTLIHEAMPQMSGEEAKATMDEMSLGTAPHVPHGKPPKSSPHGGFH
ncbi:MAG: hypothetical protein DCC43_01920 [Candidatus Brocadia sp.]|uniref:DUF4340 domain-containing protein n=1 Tax=Candidatus Brocadia fulgida TaxID=380242 RepID=A0A0M2UYY8_9BACT|nr:MAG: hypothetical protein BROFUL_01626 [Candidatus Brocadia fulgida]MCC6326056.1 DUF4340 domain-containing protein [Candidatus Brocadia sp.]MCE7910745.1 DUF4340 domain-containing protein [Candidatus Brocadia sp. AMX3]MBV6518809.1 hypothetical protein [Candidatus Brocadia fulgida]MDG5996277.1 DUF4340 domain-containing protein [Candidatus Brocadia sp.]